MAAVDLSATATFPRSKVTTSVGTNWQEFTLPPGQPCKRVSVYLSAAGKVAWSGNDSATVPADAGASGSTTNKESVAATTWTTWELGPPGFRPAALFVAADAATITVTLSLEG